VGGMIGDEGCIGNPVQQQACNTQLCPSWSTWLPNGECSSTCGNGEQLYTRNCLNGVRGDIGCIGNPTKTETCNEGPCPVWRNWSSWGDCSRTCRAGTQERTRSCENGEPGEGQCLGSPSASQSCNTHACTTQAPATTASSKCAGKTDKLSLVMQGGQWVNKCVGYTKMGYCKRYISWMNKYCSKSCCEAENEVVDTCVDSKSYCQIPIYIEKYCGHPGFRSVCRKSCPDAC
jgi:hypothetical protein